MMPPHPHIRLRQATDADDEFLAAVYASTREPEMAMIAWTDAQKEQFLRMQFEAQHRYYHEHYHDTSWEIILFDGEPVGRLYVARWPDEIRIVDIALLPRHRGGGIGSFLLGMVIDEADSAGKPLRIHVEQDNPAMHWYQRLGFNPVGQHGVYRLMERGPTNVSSARHSSTA